MMVYFLVNLATGNLKETYSYYRHLRHALFHIENLIDSSIKVKSLAEALNICDKVYTLIEHY